MEKTILLIDGSSFIFRAFHALPNLTAPDGSHTGATYGIINMLKQMQKKYTALKWGCVFDVKGGSFRNEIYPAYKAHRPAAPTELISQLKNIYAIISDLGIPVIMKNGFEADDIIGTIAVNAQKLGYKVLIATSDKDFAQLVNQQVTLINTMTDEVLDEQGVLSKFGVAPNQIIDYLALIGDKVDNVPGVEKCGPKTAVKWLAQFKTLENLLTYQNDISGVVGENLRKASEWLKTGKTLVTIDTGVDLSDILPLGLENLVLSEPKVDSLVKHYSKLGFKNWLRQLQNTTATAATDLFNNPSQEYQDKALVTEKNKCPNTIIQIESEVEFTRIIAEIIKNNVPIVLVAIPDNIKQPNYLKHIFIGYKNFIYIVNNQIVAQDELFSDITPLTNHYQKAIGQLMTSPTPKITANAKELFQMLSVMQLELANVIGDVTLAHYVLDSRQPHSISYIFEQVLQLNVTDLPSNLSKNGKSSQLIIDAAESNIKNCTIICQHIALVEQILRNKFDQQELKLYSEVELPLARLLTKIEANGIMVDVDKFKVLEQQLTSKLAALEHKIHALAGCAFNINSPKQLQDILFDQLKLPTQGLKKNSTGFSTDENTLSTLQKQGIHIATLLLEYRTLSKLLNTYIVKLPPLVDKQQRLHTTYDQTVVISGRLASRDPNLQNIPVRHDLGREIRQCFIAQPKHVLICADYSQIELRVLAHFSQDENLIYAFNHGLDIHSTTASQIFNKPIAEISRDERRYAKIINFSLLYGKSVFGLSNELDIDRATAKAYIDTYFAKYPKVLICLDSLKQSAHTNGYVTTAFGRKIYLPNINSQNKIIRDAEERVSLNAPMQGTSADIIKIAMNNVDRWLKQNKLKTKLILQVHDELILEAPEVEAEIVQQHIQELMTQNIELSVKLEVSVKTASNWDAAH